MVNSDLPNKGGEKNRGRDREIDRDREIYRERERDIDNELTNNNLLFNYSDSFTKILGEIPPELVNKVLTNYTKGGRVAPQVIAYILDNQGWTIPTLSHLFRAPKQTIDQILKKLRPWVIQTSVKLEKPIKGPGNQPYVWIRVGVDPKEAENEARAFYNDILEKHDPATKRAREEMRAREEAIAQAQTDRDELVARVIKRLGSPPQKMGPIYEALRLEGVGQGHPDRFYVSQMVQDWMHTYEEAGD